jgi:hypothetical protein
MRQKGHQVGCHVVSGMENGTGCNLSRRLMLYSSFGDKWVDRVILVSFVGFCRVSMQPQTVSLEVSWDFAQLKQSLGFRGASAPSNQPRLLE